MYNELIILHGSLDLLHALYMCISNQHTIFFLQKKCKNDIIVLHVIDGVKQIRCSALHSREYQILGLDATERYKEELKFFRRRVMIILASYRIFCVRQVNRIKVELQERDLCAICECDTAGW